ncbi:hypothetical protein AB8E32_09600 [Marinomonas polaris]|uniref:hypothetical protein n=1 Tax=Marinomonas polaris TaxID=293552 RepID=UPI003511CB34
MYVFLNYEDDPTEAYIDARDKMTGEEKAEVREEIRKLDKAFPEHFASLYKGDPKFSGCPYHETCSGLIKPDTILGGNIATLREVFNDKTSCIFSRV